MITSHAAGSSVSGTRVEKTWVGWEAGCNLILIALGRVLARWDDVRMTKIRMIFWRLDK